MERWKDVLGYIGMYQVSDTGTVKSLRRKCILRPSVTPGGYAHVSLCWCGKAVTRYVHRLVAEAFLSVKSFENYVVNHIDGCSLNNSVENLEWVSQRSNILKGKWGTRSLPPNVSRVRQGDEYRFRVRVRFERQQLYLGSYRTVRAAGRVAVAARKDIVGGCFDIIQFKQRQKSGKRKR